MPIMTDISNERVKLVRAIHGSKFAKAISDSILMPILNDLEENVPDVLEEVAQWAVDRLSNYLRSITPSGRSYAIYQLDPTAPYGERQKLIDVHRASSPGQPPARLTKTLANSMEFKIYADGSFEFGLLKKVGEYSKERTEFESAFYRAGKIFVGKTWNKSKTPVGTYGRILEDSLRPWFEEYFEAYMREPLRQRVRKRMKDILKKSTRRISVRRGIVFKVYFT